MVFDMPLDMYSDMPLYDICHAFDTHSVMPFMTTDMLLACILTLILSLIWTFASDAISIKIIIFIYHSIGAAKNRGKIL
jgi:hypothetical protein